MEWLEDKPVFLGQKAYFQGLLLLVSGSVVVEPNVGSILLNQIWTSPMTVTQTASEVF